MTTDTQHRATAGELQAFVERMERLNDDAKGVADSKKDLLKELKGQGYDEKAFKAIVALRARDANDIAEEEAILELYKEALGM